VASGLGMGTSILLPGAMAIPTAGLRLLIGARTVFS
jgi:hypothetical protein